MTPVLTIFTAPKPFVDPHIINIQMNAIRSWKALGEEVAVVLIGNETGIDLAATELGTAYIPEVGRNEQGTPLISSIFRIGRDLNQSPLLAYVNADILLFADFLETAKSILELTSEFLIVGQRYDLEVLSRLNFNKGWEKELMQSCQKSGKLHPRGGSDYFIFPRTTFVHIPDFAVGRAGWDNWMFYQARKNHWKTIDATPSIFIIHQNHDYSHLPGGQTHYRLPETAENVRLAGGERRIFSLLDVNYEFVLGKMRRYPIGWKKFWREIEIFPLIYLNSTFLAQIIYFVFHPSKAYIAFRKWIRTKTQK